MSLTMIKIVWMSIFSFELCKELLIIFSYFAFTLHYFGNGFEKWFYCNNSRFNETVDVYMTSLAADSSFSSKDSAIGRLVWKGWKVGSSRWLNLETLRKSLDKSSTVVIEVKLCKQHRTMHPDWNQFSNRVNVLRSSISRSLCIYGFEFFRSW